MVRLFDKLEFWYGTSVAERVRTYPIAAIGPARVWLATVHLSEL